MPPCCWRPDLDDFLASRCLGPSRLEVLRLIQCGNSSFSLSRYAFLLCYLDLGMNSRLLTSLCVSCSWHLPVSFLSGVITSSHFIVALLKVRISSSLFVSTDLFRIFWARHSAGVGTQPCSGWEPTKLQGEGWKRALSFPSFAKGASKGEGKPAFHWMAREGLLLWGGDTDVQTETVKMSWALMRGQEK